MTPSFFVQIVGAPVACAEGVKDTWREVAALASDQLGRRFGEAVRVEYFDLFDPACPPVPLSSQLPLVFINGEVFSSGGKISVPAIRKRLEVLGGIQAQGE
ncbi:MAG: YuzD family protein [Anaerolineae bacterium]|nr:YuzD family protein [Anaerolineae bacterium]